MPTLVMKFGGNSVGMTTGLTQLLSIVLFEQERWERLLLVVSALEGVTDALLEAARLAQLGNRRGYRRIVGTLRTRHLALIEHLPLGSNEQAALQADIDRLLFDMLDTCQALADSETSSPRPEAIDAIIGVGERLAARIVAALLRQNGLRGVAIDATDIVITDNVYGNATPNLPLTRERINEMLAPMLERKILPVITGFIGATTTGTPTTLGRGGSDYTASILAACTDAQEVWIWTDVDGMMTADPRDVEDARVIPRLSYNETAELAYFGARLLHARMIAPLQDRRISLRVRNVFKPQSAGTTVGEMVESAPQLKAVTRINGLGLFASHNGALHAVMNLVDDTLFDVAGIHAEVVFTSQSAWQSFIGFLIPTSAGPDALHALDSSIESRIHNGELSSWTHYPVTILTVIGSQMNESRSTVADILLALEGLQLLALSQSPSNASFSVVLETSAADEALLRVHSLLSQAPAS